MSGRTLRRRQIDDLVAEGFIEEDALGRIRVTSIGAPLLELGRRRPRGVSEGGELEARTPLRLSPSTADAPLPPRFARIPLSAAC